MTKEQKIEVSKFDKYYTELEEKAPFSYYLDKKVDLESWKTYAIEETAQKFTSEEDDEENALIEETKKDIENMNTREIYKYMIIKFGVNMEEEAENFKDTMEMFIQDNDAAHISLILQEIGNYIPAMQSVLLEYDINEYMWKTEENNKELYHSVNKNDTSLFHRIAQFIKDNGSVELIKHIEEVLLEELIVLKGLQIDTEKLKKEQSSNKTDIKEAVIAISILKTDKKGINTIQKKGVLSLFKTEQEANGKGIKQ